MSIPRRSRPSGRAAGYRAHYQLVIQREGSMDTMTVEVEARFGVPVGQYPAIAKKVANHIKAMVGSHAARWC